MSKVQRVKKVQLWSIWRIALLATLLSGVVDCFLFLTAYLLRSPTPQFWTFYVFLIVFICIFFVLPACLIIRYHTRLRFWWHGTAFGAVYGMMLLVIAWLCEAAILMISMWGSGRLPPVEEYLLASIISSAICAILFTIVWIASRKSRGRLLITDKTYCPYCGYNLIGNTTYICPECGQPFTLEELEISEDDLNPTSQNP